MTDFDTPAARSALKEAVTEALRDNRDWLRELVQDALVEVATAEAHREADLRAAHHDRQPVLPVPHGRA